MMTLLIGRILQIALTVCQIRLATTLLGPAEYGVWILFVTIVSFFVLLGVSPFGLYLNRHINDWKNNNLIPEVFRGYNVYLLLVTAISFIFFVLIQVFKLYTTDSIILSSALMAFLLLTQTFNQTWVSILNLFGLRKSYVLGSIISIVLGLLIILILAFFDLKSAYWWGLGIGLGLILGTLIFIPRSWYSFDIDKFQSLKRSLEMKQILLFSGPLFLSTIFFWIQTQGYRFIIENKVGLEEFGKFAAGQAVVSGLFTALDSVIAGFYQPTFFKNISDGSPVYVELRRVWDMALYPFILAGCFLYFLASDLSVIFLSRTFVENNEWIAWVALAECFRVIFNLLVMNFHGTKKTSSLLLPHGIGLLVSVIFISQAKDLSFTYLSLFLSLGYFISILLLFFIDWRNFYSSGLLSKLGKAILISLVFFCLSFYLCQYFMGYLRVAILSFLGIIFMTPYYFKNVRNSK